MSLTLDILDIAFIFIPTINVNTGHMKAGNKKLKLTGVAMKSFSIMLPDHDPWSCSMVLAD